MKKTLPILGATLLFPMVSFAAATVVSINPPLNSLIPLAEPEDISFTLTYSEPVKIDKENSGYGRVKGGNFNPSNAENSEYSTEWKLTFPKEYIQEIIYGWDEENSELAPGVNGIIYAIDKDGSYATNGSNDYIDVYYRLDYTGKYGVPVTAFIDSEAEGYLNTFTVPVPEGFQYISGGSYRGITVTGENFTATAISVKDGVVTFSPYINKSGTYEINLPYGAFIITKEAGEGQEGDTMYSSAEGVIAFDVTINNPAPDQNPDINPDTPEGVALPINEEFTPLTKTNYIFTPTTEGVLSLNITDGDAIYYFWLDTPLLSLKGEAVEPFYTNGSADSFMGATEFRWNLTGGETYVFNLSVSKTPEELGIYEFTYTGDFETGIKDIDANEGEAEFYNLSGVRVNNPERGIFVKVQNGKAQKVVR